MSFIFRFLTEYIRTYLFTNYVSYISARALDLNTLNSERIFGKFGFVFSLVGAYGFAVVVLEAYVGDWIARPSALPINEPETAAELRLASIQVWFQRLPVAFGTNIDHFDVTHSQPGLLNDVPGANL